MSEWKLIETAPVGVTVRLGWWEDRSYYTDKKDALIWRTDIGIATEMRGFIIGDIILPVPIAESGRA